MSNELEPRIRSILQATPLEKLGTITAKDVRAQLVAEGSIDDAWVKANKKSLNALISGVFEAVSAPLVPVPPVEYVPQEEYVDGDAYSEREASESQSQIDGDADGDDGPSTPPRSHKKSHKKAAKSKRELTDEEYARQLAAQLNGRERSSRTGKALPPRTSKPKKGSSRTSKATKKSAERVDDSDDSASDGGGSDDDSGNTRRRAAKPRKTRKSSSGGGGGGGGGGGAKGGFGKEYLLSEPLSALLEVDRLSRPQVVKQLWVYIKGNNLQNPSNKKEILCDDRLRPVFNTDKIDMFKMNKVLGQHLHEME